jgi:hypothetical protein
VITDNHLRFERLQQRHYGMKVMAYTSMKSASVLRYLKLATSHNAPRFAGGLTVVSSPRGCQGHLSRGENSPDSSEPWASSCS